PLERRRHPKDRPAKAPVYPSPFALLAETAAPKRRRLARFARRTLPSTLRRGLLTGRQRNPLGRGAEHLRVQDLDQALPKLIVNHYGPQRVPLAPNLVAEEIRLQFPAPGIVAIGIVLAELRSRRAEELRLSDEVTPGFRAKLLVEQVDYFSVRRRKVSAHFVALQVISIG